MSLELEVLMKTSISSVDSPTHSLTRISQDRVQVRLMEPCFLNKKYKLFSNI